MFPPPPPPPPPPALAAQIPYHDPTSQLTYHDPASQLPYHHPTPQLTYHDPTSQLPYHHPTSQLLYHHPTSQLLWKLAQCYRQNVGHVSKGHTPSGGSPAPSACTVGLFPNRRRVIPDINGLFASTLGLFSYTVEAQFPTQQRPICVKKK